MTLRQNHSVKDTWLVQRLLKPNTPDAISTAPFSFGGGRPNGGLSKETLAVLKGVFVFDYMGAAEFEFGAVPQALYDLSKSPLCTFETVISSGEIKRPFYWKKGDAMPAKDVTVYMISKANEKAEVLAVVRQILLESHRLKEGTRFDEVIYPPNYTGRSYGGWLALDAPFMFFSDKEMFEKTAKLYGISP